MEAAQIMMKFGIPVFAGSSIDEPHAIDGVIFSLKGPQTVKQGDPALSMSLYHHTSINIYCE